AFAEGLEDDRERAVARRHLEQRSAALALLPERRARPRPAPRQQQCPGRALAEPAREQGGPEDGVGRDVLDLLRLEKDRVARWSLVGFREPDDDTVVVHHGLDLQAQAFARAQLDGVGPG